MKKTELYNFPRVDRRFWWIFLGALTLVIDQLLGLNPNFVELFYSRGFFWLLRWVWDYSFGLIPIPLMYVGIILALFFLQKGIRKSRRRLSGLPWRNRLGSMGISVLAFCGGALFFFQFLWGFNYNRMPVETYLQLPKIPVDSVLIHEEAMRMTHAVIEAREQIVSNHPHALEDHYLPDQLESKLRTALHATLNQQGYSTPGRVRGREVFLPGWLMRMGAIGIYLPYLGEGSVDAGVPRLTLPFTMCHEMVHGLGFGDEGTANFWAYLSCENSGDPYIVYSGRLVYWRHIARQLYRISPDAYDPVKDQLPPGVVADLVKIRETYQQYPPFLPQLFDMIYNSYLKSQGVTEGKLSYDRVVQMVMAWEQKQREEAEKEN